MPHLARCLEKVRVWGWWLHGKQPHVGRAAPYWLDVVRNQGAGAAPGVRLFAEIMHENTGFPGLEHVGAWTGSASGPATDDIPVSVT